MTSAPEMLPREESEGSDRTREKKARKGRDKTPDGISITKAKNVYVASGKRNHAGNSAAHTPGVPRRVAIIAAYSTIVAAVVTVLAFVLAHGFGDREPDPRQSPSTVVSDSPPDGAFAATITRTMDVPSGRLVGVKAYRDPSPRAKGTREVALYPENGTVSVVCKTLNGREIRDDPWQDRALSTTVWYRLSTPEPQWIPDMYVTLRPDAGSPDSVPVCR
ncbi:hypothetical protein [Micromonospora chersina]|uniref:hypothetical protein n=1 Tax=Micromonospora chersina TaxID=47854 RepID=UPI0033DC3AF9